MAPTVKSGWIQTAWHIDQTSTLTLSMVRCLAAKGDDSMASSYSTQPSDQISDTISWPCPCSVSGDMYSGVPTWDIANALRACKYLHAIVKTWLKGGWVVVEGLSS